MSNRGNTYADLRRFLAGKTAEERQQAMLEVIRESCSQAGHILDRTNLLSTVAKKLGMSVWLPAQVYEYNPNDIVEREIDELFWDWTAAGFGVPRIGDPQKEHGRHLRAFALLVTDRGLAHLRAELPHPATAAFVDGLKHLPDEIRARLEDAAACLRVRLLRAATVMVGIAYEAAVDSFQRALPKKGGAGKRALERIQAFQAYVTGSMKGDERRETLQALAAAFVVAEQRNRASHPGPDDFDRAEIEQLLWHAPRWVRVLLAGPSAASPGTSVEPS